MRRMTATDARMYWTSLRVPGDQILLYVFDGSVDVSVGGDIAGRAHSIERLGVRVQDVRNDFPWWVRMPLTEEHVHLHRSVATWTHVRGRIEALTASPLDSRISPWRVHVWCDVTGVLGRRAASSVVAVHISHALADGTGTAALAGALLGRAIETAPPLVRGPGRRSRLGSTLSTVGRGVAAARAERALGRDTAAGLVPPASAGRALTAVNRNTAADRVIRCVVLRSGELRAPGVGVTAGAATVVSLALERYLGTTTGLTAETTFAKPGPASAHNHFRNGAVDLHTEITDPAERARRIAQSVRDRRARFEHRYFAASDRVTDVMPPRVVHADIERFDVDTVPATVTGTTVISSVDRGAADLVLGGRPVIFTAGFPALSPVMGLTHGVHGLGDTVTVSILADSVAVPDVDRYEDIVRRAAADVGAALGGSAETGGR